MILQALYQYYNRLREEPDSGIAMPGFAPQQISFVLVIDKNGKLIGEPKDIRRFENNKSYPIERIVPVEVTRAGKPTIETAKPNFLWDNTGYVLGADLKGKPENEKITFTAFKNYHNSLCEGIDDEGLKAVLRFINKWDRSKVKTLKNWEDIAGSNLVFQLEGERRFIHERPKAKKLWLKKWESEKSGDLGICLVTGAKKDIERIHRKIKGVRGAQSSGASIVGFNEDAYCSYGKEQSFNAPVSKDAVFAYTTVLNHLLKNERQKIQIGDATTVFWTERKSPIESLWGVAFNPPRTDEADNKQVYEYLSALREGKNPRGIDPAVRMYVLGLSPNASRIAIRFCITDTIESFNRHLGLHFQYLHIQKQFDTDKEFPGIWHLLIETLPKKKELRKTENINPVLAGALTRSILNGGRYPESLLATIITRLRTDGDVSYCRTALVKALLMRNYNKEVSMSLNEKNPAVAYRLGRLFAVLEKAQEEAIPGANATIKDRFYGSASATPGVVFPQLMRMSQHHLSKIGGGSKVNKEKLIQSILDQVESFPAHLNLEEQGLFTIGYYHQRNSFFQKKEARQNGEHKD